MSLSSSSDDDNTLWMIPDTSMEEASTYSVIRYNNDMILQLCVHHLNSQNTHGGLIPGHIVVNRDREAADCNLWDDYFFEHPHYNAEMFQKHYRMYRSLLLRIVEVVTEHDIYLQQRRDNVGQLGLSNLQKIIAAFQMLAYGVPIDAIDEYVKIDESMAIESLKRFCHVVVEIFSRQYLRTPNVNDIARLLHIYEKHGFPGMLGSLDYMHWKWKNCPTTWAGQYKGRYKSQTVILETVADSDLWIWHAYFGMPGTNNVINVLNSSTLFSNLAKGIAPPTRYTIQGRDIIWDII